MRRRHRLINDENPRERAARNAEENHSTPIDEVDAARVLHLVFDGLATGALFGGS